MRCLWEECDIRPGRRFGKLGVQNAAGVIGYYLPADGPKVYTHTLVALSDGLQYLSSELRSEIAAALNSSNSLPDELLES